MALTVKGAPMAKVQQDNANNIISVGQSLNASTLAITACVFDAIFESDLGADLTVNSAGYSGLLGGEVSLFGNPSTSQTAMITSWYKGGKGFQAGGGIAASKRYTDVAVLGSQVTAAIPFDSRGVSTQYESQSVPGGINGVVAEARAIVAKGGGGALVVSGTSTDTATAGGTTPFYVGDTTNPNEDVWTAVNRLAQDRQWYIFSDGETVYLADGNDLMAQDPVLTLDRWADADLIMHLDFTWDNTAYQYTSTHKRRAHIQRKSTMAKVTSPVTATLQVICNIDDVRAGDVVALTSCGPGDGRWLVGECVRSVFLIYSELTLVPGIQPLSEAAAEGGTNSSTGKTNNPTPNSTVLTFGKGQLSAYTNMFTFKPGQSRIDMGVDYNGSGKLVAIGDGHIDSIANTGWPGGAFIEQSFTAGPFAGKHWYYAENIAPLVRTGDNVKAGDAIGLMQGGIETGWSIGDGGTTLAAHLNQIPSSGDAGGWTSAAGASANRFLVALGAPSGKAQGAAHGSMPPGYP